MTGFFQSLSRCLLILHFASYITCEKSRLTQGRFLIQPESRFKNCFKSGVAFDRVACCRQCAKFQTNATETCAYANYRQNDSTCELCSEGNELLNTQQGWEGLVFNPSAKFKDCSDWYKSGHKTSGIYLIHPRGRYYKQNALAYCDMDTDGGGWTVFQKRFSGEVDFYLGWQEYKDGFGQPDSEYWLGNDNIHDMTSGSVNYELRVDLEDFENETVFAQYSSFAVADETNKYKLSVSGYDTDSTAGNRLTGHNGKFFSTKDTDNDNNPSGSCSQSYKGAWWYSKCHSSNLNGQYLGGPHASYADGLNWGSFRGNYYSLKRSEMKTRPVDFGTA